MDCCPPPRSRAVAASPSAGVASSAPSVAGAEHVVWCDIPAGIFRMGSDDAEGRPGDREGPVRDVSVAAFRIAAATVTNADFAAFVRATGHVSDAERAGDSFVFYLQLPAAQRASPATRSVAELPWWVRVADASWQRPEGPGSHVRDRPGHPVVHVSWRDAAAYCAWSGTRLPSEAEWERAARGGLEGKRFAWGDDLNDAAGVPRCHVFRGEFPGAPTPGWTPAPIAARQGTANGFGLVNVCGNVWEWCVDREADGRRAMRGGSFLCHDSYCNRYRVAGRHTETADTSTSHIGFRVAANEAR